MRRASKATIGCLICAGTMTASYEGLRTHAYRDSVGVVTICEGETAAERPGLRMGDVDTVEHCKEHLPIALRKYDDGLTSCLTMDMPEGMHVVMISTTYNIGVGAFCKSSMARKINAGDFVGACHALRLYNRGGGQVIPGLDRRRRLEERDCLKGITQPIPIPQQTPEGKPTPWKSLPTSSPSSASLPSLSSSSSSSSAAGAKPLAPSRPVPLPVRSPYWLNRLLHYLLW